jgi:hypothetical protein
MAAIDKIYANKNQYDEFYLWCKQNKPEALDYFYKWPNEWDDGQDHPITNFPEWIDKWMLENCPLSWVIEKIKDQYNLV